jgi:hypothetical protein
MRGDPFLPSRSPASRIGASLAVCLAVIAPALRAQSPVWDPARHILVVTSRLDSAAAYALLSRALQAEGLELHPDPATGRIVTAQRPSDSYGAQTFTIEYLALVHRTREGGSEVWLGGLLRMQAGAPGLTTQQRNQGWTIDRQSAGDVYFVTPRGGSSEWRRLERVAQAIQDGSP